MSFEQPPSAPASPEASKKNLRESITEDTSLEALLEQGFTHQQILAEIEDMTEDGYGYNKALRIAEEGASLVDPNSQEGKGYKAQSSYLTEVLKNNPEEGYQA